MAVVTMRQLLDSGVHFGHQTRRWNPKMRRFIFTERNGIYIIDLQQTLSYVDRAYEFVKQTVAHGGTVMFVGTKKQAQEAIDEQATRVGMPFVNQRWLGGMLTNFQTVHKRLVRLKELEAMEQAGGFEGRTKKEILMLSREHEKLEKTLGGIRDMARVPSAVWIVDTKKEHIAVGEARKLNIPVVAILDTNCDPDEVDYPIPGNDDAIRSAALLTRVVAQACVDGLQARGQRDGGGRDEGEPLAEWEQELAVQAEEGSVSAPTSPAALPENAATDAPGDRPVAGPEAETHADAPGPDQSTPQTARPERVAGVAENPAGGNDAAIDAAPPLGTPREDAKSRGARVGVPDRPPPPPGTPPDTITRDGPTVANYTAADVKKLRDLTGSGMMDCKKALEENSGDLDKAVEALRIKGAKDVGKRAGRTTANGIVAARDGAMIELNSETDFVAKNPDFVALADDILGAAVSSGAPDTETLKTSPLGGGTVDEAVQALSARIGEKLELRRMVRLDGPTATYLHRRSSDLPPAIGVVVAYAGDDAEAARGAAMQVAAARPLYTTREEVPADVLDGERRVAEATAREEGKPEKILDKIVEGRLNGYYKDTVLLEQPSVSVDKKTVGAVLKDAGVEVRTFARFEVGQP